MERDSAAPHSLQNLAPGLFVAPQLGQPAASVAPHSLQNFAPAAFSEEQFGQITRLLYEAAEPHTTRDVVSQCRLTSRATVAPDSSKVALRARSAADLPTHSLTAPASMTRLLCASV